MYRVIVAGGRDFTDYEFAKEKINEVIESFTEEQCYEIVIVSGKAAGADALGERFAEEYGLEIDPYPAKWKVLEGDFPIKIKENQYGKYNALAGFNRNELMSQNADALIALPGGSGTADMVSRATKQGLKIYDYRGGK